MLGFHASITKVIAPKDYDILTHIYFAHGCVHEAM